MVVGKDEITLQTVKEAIRGVAVAAFALESINSESVSLALSTAWGADH